MWGSKPLLDVVEQILGPEIAGHPVWNLRSKTPLNPLATVPWHQDTAYLAPGAEHTLQPTAWIPFLDADAVNGTLQVIRGGHRSGQVFRHRPERTRGHEKSWYLYIADEDLPAGEIVTCEMPLGSLLLINQLIPHRSTENLSDKIRWSVDLRWQRPDEPSGFESRQRVHPHADRPGPELPDRLGRLGQEEPHRRRHGPEADGPVRCDRYRALAPSLARRGGGKHLKSCFNQNRQMQSRENRTNLGAKRGTAATEVAGASSHRSAAGNSNARVTVHNISVKARGEQSRGRSGKIAQQNCLSY